MLMGLFLMTIRASDVTDLSGPPTTAGEVLPHCPEQSPNHSENLVGVSHVSDEEQENHQKTRTPSESESDSDEDEGVDPSPRTQELERAHEALKNLTYHVSKVLAKEKLPIEVLIALQNTIKQQSETNAGLFKACFCVPTLRDPLFQHQQQMKAFLEQIQKRIEAEEQKLFENSIQQAITEMLKELEKGNVTVESLSRMKLIISEKQEIVIAKVAESELTNEARQNYLLLYQRLGSLSQMVEHNLACARAAEQRAIENENRAKRAREKRLTREIYHEVTGGDGGDPDDTCCCCF